MLKPRKIIDKDQVWFRSKRWQQGEKEADEDIRAGRIRHFPDSKSAIAYLRNQTNMKKEKDQ